MFYIGYFLKDGLFSCTKKLQLAQKTRVHRDNLFETSKKNLLMCQTQIESLKDTQTYSSTQDFQLKFDSAFTHKLYGTTVGTVPKKNS